MAEEGPHKMELVEVKAEDIMGERQAFYDRFMTGTTWSIAATVVLMILMWIFLV